MVGLPAWGAKQGHGSFLTFEFGQPSLEVKEWQSPRKGLRRSAHVHGEWHVWIYCCDWRFLQRDQQLAWSEDGGEKIARAAAMLSGQKLMRVDVEPSQGRSTFWFDLGGVLETWPYDDASTEEQWHIYGPVDVFTYRGDGCFSVEPRDKPSEATPWAPLMA